MNLKQIAELRQTDQESLQQAINDRYVPKVTDELEGFSFLQLEKSDRSATIRILQHPQMGPVRTITKDPNGVLHDTWHLPGPHDQNLFAVYDRELDSITIQATDRIAELAISEYGLARYARLCSHDQRPHQLLTQNLIHNAVHSVGERCSTHAGPRVIAWPKITSETNRLIRKHLLNPASKEVAEYFTGTPRSMTAAQYNMAHIHAGPLKRAIQADHNLTRFYFEHVMTPDDPPPEPGNIPVTIAAKYAATPDETAVIQLIAGNSRLNACDSPKEAQDLTLATAKLLLLLDPQSEEATFVQKHLVLCVNPVLNRHDLLNTWALILPDLIQAHNQKVAQRRSAQRPGRRRTLPGDMPLYSPIQKAGEELTTQPPTPEPAHAH